MRPSPSSTPSPSPSTRSTSPQSFSLPASIHSGWESSNNNGHGDKHPPRLQPALRGGNLSLALSSFLPPFVIMQSIDANIKLRLPKRPLDIQDCACFCAPAKTCKHCGAVPCILKKQQSLFLPQLGHVKCFAGAENGNPAHLSRYFGGTVI